MKDLIGKKFGELTVIEFAGYQRPENKHDKKGAWLCRCSCGIEVVVRSSCLNCKKHVSSCFWCARKNNGLKYSNLIGKRFGRLLVLSKAERPNVKNGSQYWNVKCDCGTEKIVSTNCLNRGTTVSCGCYNKENSILVHTTHGLSGNCKEYHKLKRSNPSFKLREYIGTSVRGAFKSNNKVKNGSVWKFLLYTPQQLKEHLENLWEPWMNWDNYGGWLNDPKQTWWIDHIKPQSLFKFDSMSDPEFIECWNLSNLRPLEKFKNARKGNKWDGI